MRFLADMGIGLDVVKSLCSADHDAVHLREEGLQRLDDDRILEKAASEKRVLLTHDLDMGRLLALAGANTPSIVTFRLNDMRPANVTPHLMQTIHSFESELSAGAAVTVTDSAIRCHPLPIRRPKS